MTQQSAVTQVTTLCYSYHPYEAFEPCEACGLSPFKLWAA